MSGIDCSENPELCMPRVKSDAEDSSDSTTVVAIALSVFGVVLVAGVVAVAWIWKKNADQKKQLAEAGKDLVLYDQSKDNLPFNSAKLSEKRPSTPAPDSDDPQYSFDRNYPPTSSVFAKSTGDSDKKGNKKGDKKGDRKGDKSKKSKDTDEDTDRPSVQWRNEQVMYDDELAGRKQKDEVGMANVKILTDAGAVETKRKERGIGPGRDGIDFQYKFMPGESDINSVHPRHDPDRSNSALFDIVLVRLSLINNDFVHRSRYVSGVPFGFHHDVIVEEEDDLKPREDEVDSYESGKSQRVGQAV